MKIYTGSGDRGRTSLFSGERISKGDARIDAYGDVDELNSAIGALAAGLDGPLSDQVPVLAAVQGDLFRIGAWLATAPGAEMAAALPSFGDDRVVFLEHSIDALTDALPELRTFVLPGGSVPAGWAHLARTICRRAERRIIRLRDTGALAETGAEPALTYINRLSDFLFTVARYCNVILGVGDVPWSP